jgi:hypothetical protein
MAILEDRNNVTRGTAESRDELGETSMRSNKRYEWS